MNGRRGCLLDGPVVVSILSRRICIAGRGRLKLALLGAIALAGAGPGLAQASSLLLAVPDAVYQNVARVTVPNGSVLEQDSTVATGGLLVTGSNPNYSVPVFWTASTGNDYTVPSLRASERAGSGVIAESESDLTYYIEFGGNAGPVPVTVRAHGEASAFEEDNAENGAGDAHDNTATAFLEIFPANDFFNQVLSVAATTDLKANPGTKLFSIDQQYNFQANTVYQVVMYATAHAAYQHDAVAFVDPQFIAPDGYSILTSSGVGNSPAVAPIPAALPLFTTGLGALGLLGYRRKKAAARAA